MLYTLLPAGLKDIECSHYICIKTFPGLFRADIYHRVRSKMENGFNSFEIPVNFIADDVLPGCFCALDFICGTAVNYGYIVIFGKKRLNKVRAYEPASPGYE